jgi:hypothetical protein
VFSLVYCQGTEAICGGVIGSGNNGGTQRLCSKSSGECNVSKHISNKVLLRKGYLYIKCPRGGQAWLKPSVDVSRLPSNFHIPQMISSEKPHAMCGLRTSTPLTRLALSNSMPSRVFP